MCSAGAAGNFLATIPNLSVNAFKSVVDIDLIGSYITVKATLPQVLKSAEKYRTDGTSGMRGVCDGQCPPLTCVLSQFPRAPVAGSSLSHRQTTGMLGWHKPTCVQPRQG